MHVTIVCKNSLVSGTFDGWTIACICPSRFLWTLRTLLQATVDKSEQVTSRQVASLPHCMSLRTTNSHFSISRLQIDGTYHIGEVIEVDQEVNHEEQRCRRAAVIRFHEHIRVTNKFHTSHYQRQIKWKWQGKWLHFQKLVILTWQWWAWWTYSQQISLRHWSTVHVYNKQFRRLNDKPMPKQSRWISHKGIDTQ